MTEVETPGLISTAVPPDKVGKALERMLAGPTFQQVDRLRRFLQFIVTETLAGSGGNLKEYVIGVHVFEKDPNFDPRTDPIVRVQARRLRARLARYYQEEGQTDEVVIDLPRGRYTPSFSFADILPQKRIPQTILYSQNTLQVGAFADYSASGTLAWFATGLRDEIVHRLATSEGLRVLGERPDQQVQSEEPRLVVSGSVRGSLEKARVATHLIDASSRTYLWSESMDLALDDALAAQDTVARSLQRRVKNELSGVAKAPRAHDSSENLTARNVYLQGRYHLDQRTEEGLRKAVDLFEKTLVEDANHALAHSGLADAWTLLGHYGSVAPSEIGTRAALSAAAAVTLDANSAEAHTSLAHSRSTQDRDWSGSEREFRLAIRLSPRYATAHHWLAMSCLAPLSRLDEALEEMQVAQSLDPVSSIITRDLALVHCYRRDFNLALDQCDHAIELNPHFSPAWWALGFVQEQREDFDEAAAAFERALSLSPQNPHFQAALGRLLALSGKRKAAMKVLHDLEALAETRYVSPFEFALLHFALHQPDHAFEWLARACRDRSFDVLSLNVDPRFDPWRSDPRFAAVIRQLGL